MKPSSVAFNTLAQLIGKAATLILGLATTAVIYRTLGNSQYGAYVFVTSFILLFATISDWGTEIITLREASKDSANQEKIIITALFLRLLLSLLTIGLADLTIRLLPQWRIFVIPVTLFSWVLVGLALKVSAQPLFLARRVALFGAFGEVVNNSLYFLGIITLLPRAPTLHTALSILIIATSIAGIVCWFIVARLISVGIHMDKRIIKILIKEALPTGAFLTVFYIYNRIDVVILQNLKGNEAVGYYGLAYKVHDNLVQGAAFLMNAVFPLIAANPSLAKLKILYRRAFHVLFLAGLFLILVFVLGAPLIITIVGGQSAHPSIFLLRILIFATGIAYLNHLTGYTLIAVGRQRASLAIALCALVFNISGNLILIPHFSFTAAAFMTIGTEGLVFILSSVAIFHYTKILPSLRTLFTTFHLSLKYRGRIFEID